MLNPKAQICLILTLILACIGLEITCEILQDQEKTNMHITDEVQKKSNSKIDDEHLITVFVHGTIFNYPSLQTYKQTKKDQKKNPNERFFKKYKNNLRKKTLYNCQPINDLGLISIDFNEKNEDTKSNRLLANLYQKAYLEASSKKEINFHFYTFGWDGALSKKSRERAAQNLYEQLTTEIDKIKKATNSSNIKLEILAHSHGGNVALNLAKAEEKLKQNLSVDKLILFGTPVQSETSNFVSSSIFKKIYNIYSRGDSIQVLDILSTRDKASKRRFKDSKNLVQIEVKVGKMQPIHTELWLLCKDINFIYRKNFPLNPLPLFIFSPIITSFIDSDVNNIKNIDLHLKTKTDYLKFNFYDQDFRKNQKHAKNLISHKNSYRFKYFEDLKKQAKKEA